MIIYMNTVYSERLEKKHDIGPLKDYNMLKKCSCSNHLSARLYTSILKLSLKLIQTGAVDLSQRTLGLSCWSSPVRSGQIFPSSTFSTSST